MTAPSVNDLAGAQGKFAIFIASLLQRADVASMREFGELLRLYASTVADTDPGEAATLRGWAATIGETAAN